MPEIFQNRVGVLPTVGIPNHIYYIPNGQGTDVDHYVVDNNGIYHKVNPIQSGIGDYVHTQGVALTTWTINHNLNYYPNISVVDSSGSVVIGDVQYISLNTISVTFSGAFSGSAYLS